jgi:isochorismate pyruvate lyase
MNSDSLLSPQDCQSLLDVRDQIDIIDERILSLLSARQKYVQKAAGFKTTSQQIGAEDRVKAMIQVRRSLAKEKGLDPDFVEAIFRMMVSHFIQKEHSFHQQQ